MTAGNFAVTFETVTEESARHGDAADRGYLGQNLTFRESIELFHAERDWSYIEANSWPISMGNPPRWFTDSGEIQFASGDCRAVSLHLPDAISAASAMRIARLIGCLGIQESSQ